MKCRMPLNRTDRNPNAIQVSRSCELNIRRSIQTTNSTEISCESSGKAVKLMLFPLWLVHLLHLNMRQRSACLFGRLVLYR